MRVSPERINSSRPAFDSKKCLLNPNRFQKNVCFLSVVFKLLHVKDSPKLYVIWSPDPRLKTGRFRDLPHEVKI